MTPMTTILRKRYHFVAIDRGAINSNHTCNEMTTQSRLVETPWQAKIEGGSRGGSTLWAVRRMFSKFGTLVVDAHANQQ